MPSFLERIKARKFSSAASNAVDIGVNGDTQARLAIDAGGKLLWGSGSTTGDVTLYRDSADVLKTDDTFKVPTLFIDSIEVDTTGAVTNDVLKYDGTKFTAASVAAGGGGASVTVSETAPVSPTTGDLWFESDTARTYVYYDSFWIEIGGLAPAASVSDTAPTSPVTGQVWFNSLNGGTYVYYSSAWAEVGAVPVNNLLNLLDAKGDIFVGSADNTATVLSVGANGYFLKANSSAAAGVEWASIPTINALDDVGDVNVTSATSGQYLQWNGTNWVAATVSTDFMTSTKNAAVIVMDIGA